MSPLILLLALVTPQEVFQDAERLYNDGRFAEAAAQYESLVAEGVVDGSLYYNLGNAYFKGGRIGSAILNYERARRALPGDPDVEANLVFVNERIADRVEKPALPGYVLWVASVYAGLEPDGCAVLLSVSLLLCGGATSLLILGRWPRLFRPAVAVLVTASLLALTGSGALAAKLARAADRREAIVLAMRTEVRSGPGQSSPQLAEIHEGLKLDVRAEREGWLQVSLPTGLTGWVPRADVEVI